MIRFLCLFPLFAFVAGLPAEAGEFHLDAELGKSGNDGSVERPWRSLQNVLENGRVGPGDTVFLRTGYYGGLTLVGRRNTQPITIAAAPGHTPRLSHINIRESRNWRLSGLSVSPSHAPVYNRQPIVRIGPESEDVTLEDSVIESVGDSSGWTKEDWGEKAANGIALDGTRLTIRNNTVRNVNHGLANFANHTKIIGNSIVNFGGDGIRTLGNHAVIRSNTIKNCYKISDNHDDGIQSWSRGESGKVGAGEVVDVVLSGNKIIEHENPDHPLRCHLQGIGLFDGTYVDWVIENNLIVINHWHGITVLGARNVRVVNNTVFTPGPGKPGPAWITIARHKNGTPPENSVMANNLAQSFNLKGFGKNRIATSRVGLVMKNNRVVREPDAFFENTAALDFRPKAGGPAMDQGSAEFSPKTDIRGMQRPAGDGVDLGAFERQ